MATTTNYSWTTPDDTDLVKDGAAAIRTLGSSIDTTTKNLNPQTTTGAIAYRSSTANVNTSLPIGTAGQVLTVNSGATAPEWKTPASTDRSWSLLNSGGTALTGAATITVSGISNKNELLIMIDGASSANAGSTITARINTISTSTYFNGGFLITAAGTYADGNFAGAASDANDAIFLGKMDTADTSGQVEGSIHIFGCATTGDKVWIALGGGTAGTGDGQILRAVQGKLTEANAVTSVSLISSTGNFDAGTMYVYGA